MQSYFNKIKIKYIHLSNAFVIYPLFFGSLNYDQSEVKLIKSKDRINILIFENNRSIKKKKRGFRNLV